ncbi:MFS transporter [Tunturiibacter gelidiferens]|uniref:MFS transporter n=1 Tax=Tunturiibacter gelidiferens TaxID=3069689 RepID=UPI003D9AD5A9
MAQTEQLTLAEASDRLDRLPASRFHAKILIVAALSLLFDTLDTAVTGFVLASLRTVWHFDAKTIGVVSAIGLSGYLVGSAICGFVADHLGRKKTILFTLILYSVFSASRGLTHTVGVFAFFNFFTWFFVGAESSTVPPYLAELWPSRIRGKLVGWMMAFFGAGIALSSVWALLIIPTLGWRWALFLTAPFALIGGVMRSVLPESPRWLIRVGRLADAEAVLRRVEDEVAKSTGRVLPPVAPSPGGPQVSPRRVHPRELLGTAYRSLTLMLWAAWFAEYGVLYTYQIFLPTILSAEGHSIVNSFRYSVVIYSAAIPGYVLGGYVVEWLDRKYTILLSFASVAAFGTLFGHSQSPAQIMTFAGSTVFFLSLGSTAIYTYTPELYPTEIRATAMGIASAWGRVGAVTMLLVFGHLFAIHGKSLFFLIIDPILITASIVVLCVGPPTRGKPLQEA